MDETKLLGAYLNAVDALDRAGDQLAQVTSDLVAQVYTARQTARCALNCLRIIYLLRDQAEPPAIGELQKAVEKILYQRQVDANHEASTGHRRAT